MRQKLMIAVVPVALTLLWACQTKKTDAPRRAGSDDGAVDNGDETEKVTYEGWVKGWLTDNCISCHSKAKAKTGQPDLSTYALVKTKTNSNAILKAIKATGDARMPKDGKAVKQASIDKLAKWISDGKLEGEKTGGTGTTLVSYNGWVKGYLDKNCTSCHADDATKPQQPYLASFDDAKSEYDGILKTLKAHSMPKGASKVDTNAVTKFEAWKSKNFLEDDADGGTKTGTGTNTATKTNTGTGTGTGTDDWKADETDMKNLIVTSCATAQCHAAGKTAPDLSTRSKVESNKATVLSDVQSGKMPLGSTLTAAQKQIVTDWVTNN